MREDLAREVGNRGLAAGAGDGDGRFGLAAVEASGQKRKCAAWFWGAEHGDGKVGRYLRGARNQDGGTALLDGGRDEGCTVCLDAGEGCEQDARLHLAAVGRDAPDRDLSRAFRQGRQIGGGEKGSELHIASARAAGFTASRVSRAQRQRVGRVTREAGLTRRAG